MHDDEKTKRALSVRLPPPKMEAFSTLFEGAGLTVSEIIRKHVDSILEKSASLDKLDLGVKCNFKWRGYDPDYLFPENIGTLQVSVTASEIISASELEKLVFIIPEFFTGTTEPFRIDSYHHHRVSNARISIASTRIHRNVLSFRLVDGQWHAAIFDYTGALDRKILEQKIETVVRNHISKTIVCSLIGQLPHTRILQQSELDASNEIHSQILETNTV